MCCGRSAEELSSERKALTFAKGPCNKAKNSQQADPAVSSHPDVERYWLWNADGCGTGPLVWKWYGGVLGRKRPWAGVLTLVD